MNTKSKWTLMIILLIAVTAIMIALSACGHSTASQGTANDVSGTAANTDAKVGKKTAASTALPISSDAQTAIGNAKQLLQSQTAYRVRTTSTTSMGGQPTTGLREFVAPDRTHVVQHGQEVIIIGQTIELHHLNETSS